MRGRGSLRFCGRSRFTEHAARELLRIAFASIRDLVAIAILLDVIWQVLIFNNVRPGAALLVGPRLITLPYVLARAVAYRIVRKSRQPTPTAHVS